jgi:tetratricopeptide (TPR) repeat protein
VERLALGGLDPAGVEAFVAATRKLDDDAATLARALWAHTAGNPFFVDELLRHLDETGRALGDDVPAGVVEVVARRIGHLPAPARHTLTVASVVGASFALDTVEAAAAADDDNDHADPLDHLEAAAAAGLVTEDGPGAWRFAHTLMRDALYRRLSATRRARLHRRVAEAIEAAPGPDATRLPALAHHFAEAGATGCAAKAADYALAAAHHALALPAADAAGAFLQRAAAVLDTQQPPDHQRRARVLLELSKAHYGDARNDDGRHAALLAAEAARAIGMVEELAEAVYLIYMAGTGPDERPPAQGGSDERELVRTALVALGDQRPDLRARLLMVQTHWHHLPDEMYERAISLARQSNDRTALGDVLAQRWHVLVGTPRAPEFLAVAEELVSVEEELRAEHGYHPFLGLHPGCYDRRAVARLLNGDRFGFDADIDTLERLGEQIGEFSAKAHAARWRVVQAFMDGRFDDVPALAAQTDHLWATKMGTPRERHLAMLCWERGRFNEMVERSEPLARDHPGAAFFRGRLAIAWAAAGQPDEARRYLRDLAGALTDIRKAERLCTCGHLTEAATLLRDRVAANHLYEAMLPYRGQVVTGVVTCCLGSVDRHLGMLATVLDRWNEAEGQFETALAVDAALQSPPLLARTQFWYANLLGGMPGGDRHRAETLARAAMSTARSLGMDGLQRQLLELIYAPQT